MAYDDCLYCKNRVLFNNCVKCDGKTLFDPCEIYKNKKFEKVPGKIYCEYCNNFFQRSIDHIRLRKVEK